MLSCDTAMDRKVNVRTVVVRKPSKQSWKSSGVEVFRRLQSRSTKLLLGFAYYCRHHAFLRSSPPFPPKLWSNTLQQPLEEMRNVSSSSTNGNKRSSNISSACYLAEYMYVQCKKALFTQRSSFSILYQDSPFPAVRYRTP